LSSCSFEAKDVHFVTSSTSADAIVFPLLEKTLKSKLLLDDKIQSEIQKAFYIVVENITCDEYLIHMEQICRFVSNVDVVLNKAHISKKYNYCCPEIIESEDSCVSVENIRHCLIEHIQNNEIYVTNDMDLGTTQQKGVLLYGTNAVGKTSFIRALGICIILAQSGMFVPCSVFKYKPYKAIFSRIIGNDNLFKGLSTFAVEMSELRVILQKADQYSLILGDEVCSGTETESALSIFMAALMDIYDKQCSFIFATHFHEILDYEELKTLTNLHIYHMHVVFNRENDTMIYDRKLKTGPGTKCYGLEVCKSLHLNDDFLNKAYDLRSKYFPESRTTLDFKTSKYNAKKIRGLCELCHNVLSQEVHHVNQQKDANSDGYIGTFHKNHVANLMSLCESCHNKQHH
jgi:DNA mismatch repair protein MutS